jgi:predicted MFS family arabinose efflux permease
MDRRDRDDVVQNLVARAFWAEGVSRLGDAISMVAIPLTAVLILGASAAELALIGAAQALPILLLSMPAGAWVDGRASRWPLLITADLVRAGLLLAVPVAASLGVLSLPLLAAIALGMSAAGTLFDVSYAGWLPRLLSGDDLHRANARVELARSVAAVAGPTAGGALVAAVSAPMALVADAASFVASAVLVGSVRGREPASTAPQASSRTGLGPAELGAGIRFIAGQPLVRAVTATAGINNLARSIALGVAVLYLVDIAHLAPAEIGLAVGIGHTGYLVGALVSRRVSARLGLGRTMQLGVAVFGPSMLLFALAPPMLAGVAFGLMVFAHGLGISIHNVNQVTVRQVLTPDHLRGRVAAVFRLVIFGAIPIGTVIGGLVGEWLGLRAALVLSAVGLLAGSAPYVAVGVGRLRRIEELSASRATP